MIRATLRSALVLNGVRALSANSVPQLHKPITCMLVPRVEGTLSQRKMYGSFTGQLSQPALPTDEVIKVTDEVKKAAEIAANRQFPEYIPVLFSYQNSIYPGVWKGTEYHVKVKTGLINYTEVRIGTVLEPVLGKWVWCDGLTDNRTRDAPIRPYDQLIGGWTDVLLSTLEIDFIAKVLKPEVEKKTGINFDEFKAVLYRMQVVDGTKYLVKVYVGGDEYLHMMVHEGLNMPPLKLLDVQNAKKKEDPLVPFA